MEQKLLTEVESADYRELRADDLSLVSGGRDPGHYQLPGFDLDINWNQQSATWAFWQGGMGTVWGPGM